MKVFLFVWIFLGFGIIYAEDKCNALKTEEECSKNRTCIWSEGNSCISTIKLMQTTSNSGFSSRSYDPSNNQKDRELTKGIPDPRSKKRKNPPKKNETTSRVNR